jgi:AcrR family transcriptional regulator
MGTTPREPKRPYAPRMSPEARREQLLDSVLRVIVGQGVHKVSIDSVAKHAGVTRPVVYGHFTDSRDLLRASLEREEKLVLAQLADILPSPDTVIDADALLDAFDRFLTAVTAAPDRWKAGLSLVDSSTPQFRERVEQVRAVVVGQLEELVRRSTQTTQADVDVPLLARALLALIWESARLVLSDPVTFPPSRLRAFAQATLSFK